MAQRNVKPVGVQADVIVTFRDSAFTVTPTGLQAGVATFYVVNKGKSPRLLSIKGPGVTGAHTPTLAPGRSTTLKLKLKSGPYRLSDPRGTGTHPVRWIDVRPTSVVPPNNGSTVQPPDGWWNMCADI
jgi:hypothetical protein